MNAALRAQLAQRLRMMAPPEWSEFTNLWMAFNAIYGGEPDDTERDRAMAAVERFVDDDAARRILGACEASLERIVAIPPGDMRRDRHDPRFREASSRCAEAYREAKTAPVRRLAAAAGVLYQVRCNLVHASKDPLDDRDRMLVSESVTVLRDLVPALEVGALQAPR